MALIVQHVAQPPGLNQLFYGEEIAVQPAVLVNRKKPPALPCQPANAGRLPALGRYRLFRYHMLARPNRLGRHGDMVLVGGGNHHQVDIRRQQPFKAAYQLDLRIGTFGMVGAALINLFKGKTRVGIPNPARPTRT